MADMVTAEMVKNMRKQHSDAMVVSYVNTSAAVKAESDYCCTSGNAVNVIKAVTQSGRPIIFTPDQNLGSYVCTQTGTDMLLCEGYCPVHVNITAQDIQHARQNYPEARVMVHPECRPEVAGIADAVVSTSGMLRYVAGTDAHTYIVGTEIGMLYPLKKHYPDRRFIPATEKAVCHDMKRITLRKIVRSMENRSPVITVKTEVGDPARKALERMLQIT
jgi:quinolinate synthase